MSIFVTQAFLPPKEEYQAYLDKIYETNWLTNNGPLLQELEHKLKEYLNLESLLYVTNGTIALQLAIKSLELTGEVLTTPYSYCATTTSILWENCKPVFVDVKANDFNINPDLIEEKITDKTSAILATHVYGNPCDVEAIKKIAEKHKLPVVYDAAHAFNVKLNGKSLLSYGDIATCSFHATKVFHTVEGGSISVNGNDELAKKIWYYRSFGHVNDDYVSLGINGKNSEFHAAMGLANLPHVNDIINKRKAIFKIYDAHLNFEHIFRPYTEQKDFEYNYAYYPVVFENKEVTDNIIDKLKEADVFPRRYFYPSLNTLGYVSSSDNCPVSESVSHRVLSLPLFPGLPESDVIRISNIINKVLQKNG